MEKWFPVPVAWKAGRVSDVIEGEEKNNNMSEIMLKDICKSYENGFHAVNEFNLEIEKGEFIVFVGPSGCGKSTTLRMIAGLEDISDGELWIGDRLVNYLEPKERDLAMVFQSYALYPQMNVYDNIAFSLQVRKVPKKEINEKVHKVAGLLGLENLLKQRPKNLSGGQRQRVAIGNAIIREPKVLLMDEPLSNLDAKLRTQMRVELANIHKSLGNTIIYVTHDQTEALTLGTRIVVMKDGVVQQVDSPLDLYMRPNNLFVAGFIGSPQMNFIDAKVVVSGSEVRLMFGSNSIKLPENKAKKLIDNGYEDKTVTFGIRPEDIKDEEMFISNSPDTTLEATVKVYEMLGAEVFLYFTVETFDITVRVNPRTTARPGDTIKIALDGSKIHLFDKETQETITN